MRCWTIVLTGCLMATTLAGPALAGAADEKENELERLTRRVAELEAENAELERQMARYRNGLGQTRRPAAGQPRKSPGRPVLETGNRLLSRPQTRMEGRRVVVWGEVFNHQRERVDGTLVIELLRDGMPIDEAREPFAIPAQGRVPYARLFELEGYAAGVYSARAGVVY